MNDKEKIYNQLHHDAPIQIMPAPENLFVEYIEDGEVWYSPVVCMALSKVHNINFYDSDDVGCIDKAATCSIKKFNTETGEFEQFSKMPQKEIAQ
ncbi:pathogenicity island protein [Staphylococcus aureus]|uniref:pathogenicity island protein n=1 Tax=Staphylococcus aureus TaxID=1280 RepID=UPI00201A48E3|nr:pathogenicity island protein [Staphylococcus aureus]MCL4579921.1 pathogenicity island protein [Staphylococcus aureus]